MKGLLKKDLYMIWGYCRALLVICAVFMIVGALPTEDNYFFLIYPVLLGGVLPVTLLSYDERFGWNRTCEIFPITRAQVVHERYVLSLICAAVFFLLTMAVQAAVLLPRGQGDQLLNLITVLPVMGLLVPSVMLPICFRWGVEKGRLVYYFLIGVVVAIGLLSNGVVLYLSESTIGVPGVMLPLLFCAVLFAGSWLLSIKIYQKREL